MHGGAAYDDAERTESATVYSVLCDVKSFDSTHPASARGRMPRRQRNHIDWIGCLQLNRIHTVTIMYDVPRSRQGHCSGKY